MPPPTMPNEVPSGRSTRHARTVRNAGFFLHYCITPHAHTCAQQLVVLILLDLLSRGRRHHLVEQLKGRLVTRKALPLLCSERGKRESALEGASPIHARSDHGKTNKQIPTRELFQKTGRTSCTTKRKVRVEVSAKNQVAGCLEKAVECVGKHRTAAVVTDSMDCPQTRKSKRQRQRIVILEQHGPPSNSREAKKISAKTEDAVVISSQRKQKNMCKSGMAIGMGSQPKKSHTRT